MELNGSFNVDSQLIVTGSTSLDNGAITTDGAGNISAVSLNALPVAGSILTISGSTSGDGGVPGGAVNIFGGLGAGNPSCSGGAVNIRGGNGTGTNYCSGGAVNIRGGNGVGGGSADNGGNIVLTPGTGSGGAPNGIVSIVGNLAVSGTTSLDNGIITTNGSGALQIGQVPGQGTLYVVGSTTLDNGAITTDGVGNLTAVSFVGNATTIDGVTVTGAAASGNVITATSPTTATWQAPAGGGITPTVLTPTAVNNVVIPITNNGIYDLRITLIGDPSQLVMIVNGNTSAIYGGRSGLYNITGTVTNVFAALTTENNFPLFSGVSTTTAPMIVKASFSSILTPFPSTDGELQWEAHTIGARYWTSQASSYFDATQTPITSITIKTLNSSNFTGKIIVTPLG